MKDNMLVGVYLDACLKSSTLPNNPREQERGANR